MNGNKETLTVTGLDADMPSYRMLIVLCAYLFASQRDITPEDEAAVTRPRIDWLEAGCKVLAHLLVGLMAGLLAPMVAAPSGGRLRIAVLIVAAYYLISVFILRKHIVVSLIRLYQFRAPARVRVKCVMTPSCSDYMILAIDKYGLVEGVSKGIDRLRRCGPPAQCDYP